MYLTIEMFNSVVNLFFPLETHTACEIFDIIYLFFSQAGYCYLYSGCSKCLDLFIADVALLWSDRQHLQANHKTQMHFSLTVLWKFGP